MDKSRLGSIFWLSAIQFYAVQAFVAAAWPFPYSLKNNLISDLGNTACRVYPYANVCSPRHALMNLSFVLLALATMSGAYFERDFFQRSRLGLILMVSGGGLGVLLVGLAPENSRWMLHTLGALLSLLLGNLSLFFLASSLPTGPRRATMALATLGFLATFLFASGTYLGMGPGGMERLAAYPLSLWMIGIGGYLLKRTSHGR